MLEFLLKNSDIFGFGRHLYLSCVSCHLVLLTGSQMQHIFGLFMLNIMDGYIIPQIAALQAKVYYMSHQ